MNKSKNVSTGLQKLIDSLSYNRSIHISIHYLYDFYKSDNTLNINLSNTYHTTDYCSYIKSEKNGKYKCMKYKNICVDKAIKIGRTFHGCCYMGITEIKVPVIFNGQPVAIVFLGNLVAQEDSQDKFSAIEKNLNKLNLKKDVAFDFYKNQSEHTSKEQLNNYIKMAQIVADYITLHLKSNEAKYSALIFNKKRNENYVIYNVVSYIENNYYKDIKLDNIAKENFINPQYLSRLFKNTMEINFSEYLINTRIEHAKILLKESNEPNSSIAHKVGFNSVNYFNNSFKQRTGMTPKEYRKKHI